MGNSLAKSKSTPGRLESPAKASVLKSSHDPDFTWQIHGFSALLERGAAPTLSGLFYSCGFKWFLRVTPKHKYLGKGKSFVTLNLAIARTSMDPGCVVNAVFELSIRNQWNGEHLACKASFDFDVQNTHSQRSSIIDLSELLKSSDFLVKDSCIFSVQILKVTVSTKKKVSVMQDLFLRQKDLMQGSYTWTMNNFLEVEKKPSVQSPVFTVGGYNWYMNVHPSGDLYTTGSLSMFLHLDDSNALPLESSVTAEVTLSVLDQKDGKHQKQTARLVHVDRTGWGWSNVIPLEMFKDPSKGYLVGSKCMVKAEITIIGTSN